MPAGLPNSIFQIPHPGATREPPTLNLPQITLTPRPLHLSLQRRQRLFA
ncbi:MAG TPA: hypothetical protein VGF67_11360 [Ktedonobacteraceae bacterium]|jgi:hypothetical protein